MVGGGELASLPSRAPDNNTSQALTDKGNSQRSFIEKKPHFLKHNSTKKFQQSWRQITYKFFIWPIVIN